MVISLFCSTFPVEGLNIAPEPFITGFSACQLYIIFYFHGCTIDTGNTVGSLVVKELNELKIFIHFSFDIKTGPFGNGMDAIHDLIA